MPDYIRHYKFSVLHLIFIRNKPLQFLYDSPYNLPEFDATFSKIDDAIPHFFHIFWFYPLSNCADKTTLIILKPDVNVSRTESNVGASSPDFTECICKSRRNRAPQICH